ncbi:MAG: DNA polymerase [Balneolaceae bacterium]|nr:DNA polymerase [Balneolaceae bacterium]
MIDIQAVPRRRDLQTKMLLQVHDELIFEIPEAEQDTVPSKLKELMETAFELSVPRRSWIWAWLTTGWKRIDRVVLEAVRFDPCIK